VVDARVSNSHPSMYADEATLGRVRGCTSQEEHRTSVREPADGIVEED